MDQIKHNCIQVKFHVNPIVRELILCLHIDQNNKFYFDLIRFRFDYIKKIEPNQTYLNLNWFDFLFFFIKSFIKYKKAFIFAKLD